MHRRYDKLMELYFLEEQDTSWKSRANCKGMDPELFFPRRGRPRKDYDDVRLICESCEVKRECLEYAMELKIPVGIFGGKSERQRRRMRMKLNKGEVVNW